MEYSVVFQIAFMDEQFDMVQWPEKSEKGYKVQ